MNLLRINKEHVVNLDILTRIETEKNKAVLHFVTSNVDAPDTVTVEGAGAGRFLSYIEAKLGDSLMP